MAQIVSGIEELFFRFRLPILAGLLAVTAVMLYFALQWLLRRNRNQWLQLPCAAG